MCGLCGTLMDGPHWTEGGTDAGRQGDPADSRQMVRERAYRVRLLNRVLERFSCKADDWAGGQYVVRSLTGAAELVGNLPQLWKAVEAVSGRAVDPLDRALLERLEQAAPVSP